MTARTLRFEHVSKGFRRGQRVDTLRDLVPRMLTKLAGRTTATPSDAFWALEDVSFEVRPGQVMGVVGPNGAGKSTLLKLATGIMHPDRGSIHVPGRVGALIELAAGFHGELTGRENVYFQGAVMGLSRRTVSERFDEIVSFAGVEEFIDTPVKRYSSGMSARLGFSIAVHMDPDVLLVDEVLAVGDLEFQARAAKRLAEIVGRDVPVVVVSHQLDRILELAHTGILMSRGRIIAEGDISDVVSAYVAGEHLAGKDDAGEVGVALDGLVRASPEEVDPGGTVTLELSGRVLGPASAQSIAVGVLLRSVPGERTIFATHNAQCGVSLPAEGAFRIAFDLDMTLGGGLYRAQAFAWDVGEGRELSRASSVLIRVAEDEGIFGLVHLNPRARSLPA